MLRAINSINNQSIHATSRTERLDTYVCPFCKTKVIVKKGQIMVPHFAHAVGVVNSCTYNEYIKSKAGGESEEHLKYKLMIKEKAEAREDVERVELEVRIGNRIADTMIYYKNGSRQIVEIQLSPITIDKLEERSSDYVKEGIDPYYIFWYFGEKNKWFSKECSPIIPELRTWNYGLYKENKEQKERERRERKEQEEKERIEREERKEKNTQELEEKTEKYKTIGFKRNPNLELSVDIMTFEMLHPKQIRLLNKGYTPEEIEEITRPKNSSFGGVYIEKFCRYTTPKTQRYTTNIDVADYKEAMNGQEFEDLKSMIKLRALETGETITDEDATNMARARFADYYIELTNQQSIQQGRR